mgnify:CR=1 FL=1
MIDNLRVYFFNEGNDDLEYFDIMEARSKLKGFDKAKRDRLYTVRKAIKALSIEERTLSAAKDMKELKCIIGDPIIAKEPSRDKLIASLTDERDEALARLEDMEIKLKRMELKYNSN